MNSHQQISFSSDQENKAGVWFVFVQSLHQPLPERKLYTLEKQRSVHTHTHLLNVWVYNRSDDEPLGLMVNDHACWYCAVCSALMPSHSQLHLPGNKKWHFHLSWRFGAQGLQHWHRASKTGTKPPTLAQSLLNWPQTSQTGKKPLKLAQNLSNYHKASKTGTKPQTLAKSLENWHKVSKTGIKLVKLAQIILNWNNNSKTRTKPLKLAQNL